MSDRPIIFSAPMIRALLDGRKTQTRRLIKLNGYRPEFCGPRGCEGDPTCWGWEDSEHGDWVTLEKEAGQRMGWRDWRGAYAPGDRLYVREAWCTSPPYDDIKPSEMGGDESIRYAADGAWESWGWGDLGCVVGGRARSSIHMPRWASRLTLTVTDVRVQRVQDISEADAKAEGLATVTKDGSLWKWGIPDRDGLPGNDDHGWHWRDWKADPREAFRDIWNSIHGPDAWAANPWVCALTFTVERRNIDTPTTDEATK